MLERLRLDAVIGSDDQEREIDAGRARQHGMHQALVAGHVDEAESLAAFGRQIGEAELDGDAARLLFLEAVGVDPGQRFDQGGLAVIDVPGGSDDHGARPASVATKLASSVRQRRSSFSALSSIRPMIGMESPRSEAANRSSPLPRMARPALGMVSSGSAPEP